MDVCRRKCEVGSHRFTEFVKGRVDFLAESVHECLEKAKSDNLSDHYEQAKKCYRKVMEDMQQLMNAIRDESRYYQ